MPTVNDEDETTDTFERKGREVVIRTAGERTEIVIDGLIHPVRFLQNGRPMTRDFVKVMATSVRDLAERFVDQMTLEERYYAEIAKQRAAEEEGRGDDRGASA